MKKIRIKPRQILLTIIFFWQLSVHAQSSGAITVGGSFGNFYPVTWIDANWNNNKPTEVEISRPNVHENSSWRGSLESKFTYHCTDWGNGSAYIDTYITCAVTTFIAGYVDGSTANGTNQIIIWLRGGGTTYHFVSDVAVNPVVYDGVLNALPYNQPNGPAQTFKTAVDSYVNSNGAEESKDFYDMGNGVFMNSLSVGTTNPGSFKLAVEGKIGAREVQVTVTNPWPDYVFEKSYSLPTLEEVKTYIDQNKHLPEIPSAKEMEKNGVQLGEMNMLLLKKIEELTLYIIEQEKRIQKLETRR